MLVIDVGNTRIEAALIEDFKIRARYEFATDDCRDGFLSAELRDQRVVLSSVRDEITELLKAEVGDLLLVEPGIELGIGIDYRSMETLGMDRLVVAAAARHLYGAQACVIADMGTATTVDYLSSDGTFRGGAILPGVRSGYDGLLKNAPQLPDVDLSLPAAVIGQDTAACLRSGIVNGHMAMLQGMASMMDSEAQLVVTGGWSSLITDMLPESAVWDADLLHKGLYLIGQLNRH